MLHKMHKGVRCILDMQQLAPWSSRAPDHQLASISCFGFMGLSQQAWKHMAGHCVKIVAGSVQIGGHRGDEVASLLPSISLAKHQPGNLSNRVAFIGGLE